jgi:hypothetical protein
MPSESRVCCTTGNGVAWLVSRAYNSRAVIGGSAFRWSCAQLETRLHEQYVGNSIPLSLRLVEFTVTSELEGD